MLDWKLWRWIISAFLAIGSLYVLVPSVVNKDVDGAPELPEWWKGNLIERTISLGLDLQGGMHVDLQVDVPTALQNRLGKIGDAIQNELKTRNVPIDGVESAGGKLVFKASPDAERQINEIVKDRYPELSSASGAQAALTYEFSE